MAYYFCQCVPICCTYQAGVCTHVENPNDLRRQMARYYDFFSRTGMAPEPVVSVPYLDAFGLGMCFFVFEKYNLKL